MNTFRAIVNVSTPHGLEQARKAFLKLIHKQKIFIVRLESFEEVLR